jgi:CheY-like chemotaxis protein
MRWISLPAAGEEGLNRARSAEYGVMTVDRVLPGIDGIGVIRRLRDEGIVALIVSALGKIDDWVRGLRAGGNDYLSSGSPSPNCWPALRRSRGAATESSKRQCRAPTISSLTWIRER